MLKRPGRYHSYLFRFWEEIATPAAPVWRFSLEDPLTGRRQGFATLDTFLAYLRVEMSDGGSEQRKDEEGA